jgi:hypothetical protein
MVVLLSPGWNSLGINLTKEADAEGAGKIFGTGLRCKS